jgi:hypothetical protein
LYETDAKWAKVHKQQQEAAKSAGARRNEVRQNGKSTATARRAVRNNAELAAQARAIILQGEATLRQLGSR